ncbi:hypothetical protein GCM10028825_54140 [Spirosoma agri]
MTLRLLPVSPVDQVTVPLHPLAVKLTLDPLQICVLPLTLITGAAGGLQPSSEVVGLAHT